MAKKDDKKLLETARERFKRCVEADRDNRRLAMDDLEFLHEPGKQWDEALKRERGTRPCYEFNKIRISVKRIINDIRANRPQGKVRAVEDGDKDTASVIEGLCRNIWNVSDADAAIDTAAEYQVGGGMGAWRVLTKYADDSAWDQDILIEPIRNPFSLWADPSAKDPMKRDAEYWFLESRISKDAFKAKYGDKEPVEWDFSEFEDEDEWEDDDRVRLCEYWYKKPVVKKLALLSDGSTVDAESLSPDTLVKMTEDGQPQQLQVMRVRDVQTSQICMAIISGDRVLEGPTEWAGKHFPFVQVYGEYVLVDGKPKWFGLTRHAKDSQRLHNFNMTMAAETVALAPQAKWWATPGQAEGLTDQWARAHKENFPYLLFNPDPKNPGPPQQMGGAQVPAAFAQLAMFSSEEIKAVTGIYDASLGNKSNEQTGIAIRARQAQGEIANFNYSDNIARGIRRTWEILIDLIPKIYDTARTVRIIGSDGAEEYAQVNAIDAQTGKPVNDLTHGKYDVTITVGPSFSTQRQEAAEIYMGLVQANPALFSVAGDLIFKSLDLPYAEDMAERMRAMLPPPIQQMLQSKQQNGGKPLPPEVMAAMAQVQQAQAMMEQQAQAIGQVGQEAEQEKMDAEKAKAEVQKLLADLKVAEANLKAQEAEFKAMVAETRAQIQQEAAQVDAAGKDVAHQAANATREAQLQGEQAAQAIVQETLSQVTEAIRQLEQAVKSQPPPIIVGGGGGARTISVKRGPGGELVGQMVDQ